MTGTKNRKSSQLIETCIPDVKPFVSMVYSDVNYGLYLQSYETVTSCLPVDFTLGNYLTESVSPQNDFLRLNNIIDSIRIYTDGSKSHDSHSVGAACVCPSLDFECSKSISKLSSIFTAESMAISEALDLTLLDRTRNCNIFSDSQSALQCLSKPKLYVGINPYILEIKAKYLEFYKTKTSQGDIQFFWIPAHVGIQGNEAADKLAKAASDRQPQEDIFVPFTDLRETFKKTMYSNMKKYFHDSSMNKGKIYFENFYQDTAKPWFDKCNFSRRSIVSINRGRSNHYNLAFSLARIHIVDSPRCQYGAGDQDLDHVVWKCSLYETERAVLLGILIKYKIVLPINTATLLASPDSDACFEICKILQRCEIKL